MKEIKITVDKNKVTKFSCKGFNDFEAIGLLTFYRDLMNTEAIRAQLFKDTEPNTDKP